MYSASVEVDIRVRGVTIHLPPSPNFANDTITFDMIQYFI